MCSTQTKAPYFLVNSDFMCYVLNSAQLHSRPSALPVMSKWPRWFSGVVYWSVELLSCTISARSRAWRTAAVWKTGSVGGPYAFHLSDIPLDRRHCAGRSRGTTQVSNKLRYLERLPHQILPSCRGKFFIFIFIQKRSSLVFVKETKLNSSGQINIWQLCWITKLVHQQTVIHIHYCYYHAVNQISIFVFASGVLFVMMQCLWDGNPYIPRLCCYSERKEWFRKWKSQVTVLSKYISWGMPLLPDLTSFPDVQLSSQVILNWLSYGIHVILDLCRFCIPENYHKSDSCKRGTISPYSVTEICRLEEVHACISIPITEISNGNVEYNTINVMLYDNLQYKWGFLLKKPIQGQLICLCLLCLAHDGCWHTLRKLWTLFRITNRGCTSLSVFTLEVHSVWCQEWIHSFQMHSWYQQFFIFTHLSTWIFTSVETLLPSLALVLVEEVEH